MTLREKVLIVAEAMATKQPIWLDGHEEIPLELKVNPCCNVSINIRTNRSDCTLAGIDDVSATPSRMTTVGDRRREFAWLTCSEAVQTLEEFTRHCRAVPWSMISADARDCMKHIMKVIRCAMPPVFPDDGRLVELDWHPCSRGHTWTASESERSKKIHDKFVLCVSELTLMGINLDQEGK